MVLKTVCKIKLCYELNDSVGMCGNDTVNNTGIGQFQNCGLALPFTVPHRENLSFKPIPKKKKITWGEDC